MVLFVSAEPDIDTIHTQIESFRKRYQYDHVCMYFRDHNINVMRLFDHTSKDSVIRNRSFSQARNRRVSHVHGVFSISDDHTKLFDEAENLTQQPNLNSFESPAYPGPKRDLQRQQKRQKDMKNRVEHRFLQGT